jgi:hypothetical protein
LITKPVTQLLQMLFSRWRLPCLLPLFWLSQILTFISLLKLTHVRRIGAVLMQKGHPIAYMSKVLGIMN